MTKKATTNYFRIVAQERGDQADLYLYGYIGQDFWWDEDLQEENLTDLAVVRKIKELEQKYNRINVRINSPGGSVFHGDPIITALRSSTAEIHTYVDGMAASMAADIWLVGKVRHMALNSKLMIHSTSSSCWGTALDMMETAEMLEKFDEVAIATFAHVTNMSEEEVRERFYDYRDHWVTAKEAQEIGLIEEIESYELADTPSDAERMSYAQLVRSFTQEKTESDKPLLARLRDTIFNRVRREASPAIHNQTETEMIFEDFQKSLGQELDPEAVAAALREHGYEVSQAAADVEEAPGVDIEAQLRAAVAQAVEPLQTQIAELQQQVKAYGDLPGAAPTQVAAGQDAPDGLDTNTGTIDAIKALAAAADRRERVDVSA